MIKKIKQIYKFFRHTLPEIAVDKLLAIQPHSDTESVIYTVVGFLLFGFSIYTYSFL